MRKKDNKSKIKELPWTPSSAESASLMDETSLVNDIKYVLLIQKISNIGIKKRPNCNPEKSKNSKSDPAVDGCLRFLG
jgi:hypothetical protein